MSNHPKNLEHVFAHDPATPVGRLVHLVLAILADDDGKVQTTVHTLEHMTGLIPAAIETVLGHNHLNKALFPADVELVDGIVTATLAKA